jgi:hypothetical protein
LVVASPNGLTGSCGGGTITATAGSGNISLAGATLPANGSCTFSVDVTGTTTGTKVNTTSPVDSNEGGQGSPASATVVVSPAAVSAPTIAKAFGTGTIHLHGTTSLTGVGFVDNLPAGLVVATPNGDNGSCGGGTITATPGSSSISLAGATLPGNGSCAFSVNVTGTTSGTKVNTTGAVTSDQTGPGPSASASITVRKGKLPITGSRSSAYVTIALTTIGLGAAFIAISRHRATGRRRDTA